MIRLMIADDNKDLCLCLSNYFTTENGDIRIINMSVNGLQSITSYLELKPDVLLLDINMPGLSGIDVLDYLEEYDIDKKKNIIVFSNNYSSLIYKIQNYHKIYSCHDKPYDFKKLLDDIIKIKKSSDDINAEKDIIDLLWHLKFNIYTKATSYLKDAIILAYNDEYYLYNTDELMQEVSKKNNANKKTVRSSIDQSLNRLSIPHDLNSFFYDNYDGGRPSLKTFIAECVSYIKNNCKVK